MQLGLKPLALKLRIHLLPEPFWRIGEGGATA